MKLMTTTQVWENFEAESTEISAKLHKQDGNTLLYTYLAKQAEDGDVQIGMSVYTPNFDSKNVVLLIGSYKHYTQIDILEDLVSRGYVVCVPDYSGISENNLTQYPNSLEYGYHNKIAERSKDKLDTPLDTVQYLYAVVIRRAITFINKVLKKDNIVIVGLNEGTEIAITVAGEESRLEGLICINGASYMEYLKSNKYGCKEIEMDDDMLSWITGVSSTSYAKKIKVPVMFCLGSNSTLGDIDRLSNIFNIIPHNKIRAVITPKFINNIDRKAYNTAADFIKDCFLGSMPPEMPDIDIDITEDNNFYVNVKVDNAMAVEKVKIYYSVGDYNHATRYWREVAGEQAGMNEYISKIEIKVGNVPFFTFAEVIYKNGLVSTSLPYYKELSDNASSEDIIMESPIVYQYSSKEKVFTEVSADAVILNNGVVEKTLPVGLKGVCSEKNGLISFALGNKTNINSERILQVDVYSEKETVFSLTVITGGNKNGEYTAEYKIDCEDTFESIKFACYDFKNSQFLSLTSWEDMKGLRINNSNVVIGKIMFI